MTRSATLAALREKIGRQERPSDRGRIVATLGSDDLNRSLPDGGLLTGTLHEFLPRTHADFPAMLGFGLGMLSRILADRPGPVLWALPSWQNRAFGALYPHGLNGFGLSPDRLIHVGTDKTQNMLWALEEALGHQNFGAVIGILPENDTVYDFTASRRLSMRAARHGVTILILSARPGFAMASAAETRWSVAASPGAAIHRHGQTMPGLGPPRFDVDLVKSRKGTSGHWIMEWNHETLSFNLPAPLADRTPDRQSGPATGQWAALSHQYAPGAVDHGGERRTDYGHQRTG